MFNFKDRAEYITHVSKLEVKEIERIFVQIFSTAEGKKALAYLQYITFNRALGVNASDAQLRYAEGERSLVSKILRLIDRGRLG
jgi:hypothetical protein